MKNILSFFLGLLLLSSPAAFAQLTYSTNSDNTTVTVTGFNGSGQLTIPATNDDGLTVTAIAPNAFLNDFNITGVSIPATVTNIGQLAFQFCDSLAAFTVDTNNPAYYSSPDGVLFDISQTTLVQFPAGAPTNSYVIANSVTSIGAGAFYSSTNLTNVTIGDAVTNIGFEAFDGCAALTNVVIPDSVTAIGINAFYNASGLATLTVGAGVTSFGANAFTGCANLKNLIFSSNVVTIPASLFEDFQTLTNVVMPPGVTSIGDAAFEGCSDLISVSAPDSITNLGVNAFASCGSLINFTIPAYVTSVADGAFSECRSLTNVTIPGMVANIGDSAFQDCSSLTSIVIPDGVTTFGSMAFSGCTGLTNFTIPASVTNIELAALQNCSGLTAISVSNNPVYFEDNGVLFSYGPGSSTLVQYPIGNPNGRYVVPMGVGTIADYAFYQANNLTNLIVQDSVTNVDSFAFSYCPNLASVTFGSGLAYLGNFAFSYSDNLVSIYFMGNAPVLGAWVFETDQTDNTGVSITTLYDIAGTTGWGPTDPLESTIVIEFGNPIPVANWIPGSLQVTTSPAEALADGAAWQLDGNPSAHGSVITISNLYSGIHNLVFGTIPNWITPSNVTVNITTNQTATVTGAYIPEEGSAQVTIQPAGAVSAGAQWRVDGGAFLDSGATATNLFTGTNHVISFSTVAGWAAPTNQTITVSNDTTNFVSATYVEQFGSVQVTISPAGAVNGGAQWSVDGGALQNSGAIVSNLFAGTNHTISFTAVAGWTTPTNQTVAVSDGATNSLNATYVEQFGSVQVAISPSGAASNGAQWSVDGGALQNSGATVTNLFAGTNHTISFSTAAGWTTPADQIITVSNSMTNFVTGTYVEQFGLVHVAISPAEAVNAGAQWRVDGGSLQDSGSTVTNLFVGTNHTVSFTIISNWTTPTNQIITVSNGATSFLSATYVEQFGSLQVTISPAGAINGGAQWSVDGGALQNSGATVSNLFVGTNHTVRFSAVAGWTTPTNQIVTVTNDLTNFLSGVYVEQFGSVQVAINPAGAIDGGARWSVDGGSLQNSGAIVSNLFAGTNHTVSFNTIGNWTTPVNQIITVSNGLITSAAGIYVAIPPAVGSLVVNITPAAAATGGARWQVDGGSYFASGATATNLLAGSHAVTFLSIAGYAVPAGEMVTIVSNQTTSATGAYTVALQGSLQVTIDPSNAVSAGARWKVDGGSDQISGAVITNLTAGTHLVSFDPAPDWAPPLPQFVSITNGLMASAVGVYSNSPSSNLVTFVINGAGTIHYNPGPHGFVVGKSYTVKAVPSVNNLFTTWVGGTNPPYAVLGSNATYKFTMQSNLLLEANFVTNIFLSAQGQYNGLFAPVDSLREQSNSGSFNFNLTKTGAVSGKVILGSETAILSGKFTPSGAAVVTSTPHGRTPLTTTLQLDLPGHVVNGTVSNESFFAQLMGDQNIFTVKKPATNYEGKYTLVISGATNASVGPAGMSYGTVKVSPLGVVTFIGSLADGTPVNQTSAVSADGYWPFYVNLYGGKGSVWAWNYFTNGSLAASSNVSWINGGYSSKTAALTNGFTNQSANLIGSAFDSTTSPLPGFTAGDVILSEGGLAGALTNGVAISAKNIITLTNLPGETNKLKVTMSAATGVISGSFVNPANARQTIKFNGVILQGQTNAQGYFLNDSQSGAFELTPE